MPPVHRRCLAQILDAPPKQHPTSTCFRRSRGDRHAGGNPVYNGVCLGPSSILYINRKYGFACIYSTPLPGMQMVGTLRFFFFCPDLVKRFSPFGKPHDQSVGPTLHTWVRCHLSRSCSHETVFQCRQPTGPVCLPSIMWSWGNCIGFYAFHFRMATGVGHIRFEEGTSLLGWASLSE